MSKHLAFNIKLANLKISPLEEPAKESRVVQKTPHKDLCMKAEAFLRKAMGCSTAVNELKCRTKTREIPDAIGWKKNKSVLIECKTPRSDFLVDKKKKFRTNPELGMGDFRFCLCPEGVIKPEDLPEKWGLIYDIEGVLEMIIGPRGKGWVTSKAHFIGGNKEAEMSLLLSALRRIQDEEPDSWEKKVYRKAAPRIRRKRRYISK